MNTQNSSLLILLVFFAFFNLKCLVLNWNFLNGKRIKTKKNRNNNNNKYSNKFTIFQNKKQIKIFLILFINFKKKIKKLFGSTNNILLFHKKNKLCKRVEISQRNENALIYLESQ